MHQRKKEKEKKKKVKEEKGGSMVLCVADASQYSGDIADTYQILKRLIQCTSDTSRTANGQFTILGSFFEQDMKSG